MAGISGNEVDGVFRRRKKPGRGYSDDSKPTKAPVIANLAHRSVPTNQNLLSQANSPPGNVGGSVEKLCKRLFQHGNSRKDIHLMSLSPTEAFRDLIKLIDDFSEAIKDAEPGGSKSPGDGSSQGMVAKSARTPANDNSVALESLLPPELTSQFFKSTAQLHRLNNLLFLDKDIVETTIYPQLQPIGQSGIMVDASTLWDSLVDLLAGFQSLHESPGRSLRALLKDVNDGNRKIKSLTRQYLLNSSLFHDPSVLAKIASLKSGPLVDLEWVNDAVLRSRNMEKRPDLFGDGGKDGVKDGVKDDDDDEEKSLTLPGQFNGICVEALIDTGAHCNLVAQGWLNKNNITVDDGSSRTQTLKMANGSLCHDCPIIYASWKFDGRENDWPKAEFVVIVAEDYDVLVGLPFLKKSRTLYNSEGVLVFPEFKKLHDKQGSVPVYPVNKKSTGGRG
ncbi:hypothetical protein B0T25DRAFT_566144 [Lasiosphaeria hispida]|uniref:Uncharacterized protein n=1 Tax=Lasiosphaeria hispida TaxID=260671 RepID=A0AAJ0HL84_9PEZI|nr:hypothetical protein B0T25DRAFT_566144 [Lasiosphaeria hispida]